VNAPHVAHHGGLTDVDTPTKQATPGRPKKKKDLAAPKPFSTGWQLFKAESAATIKVALETAGHASSFGDIGKEAGARWKAMVDLERSPYMIRAATDKVRYHEEMAMYVPPTEADCEAPVMKKAKFKPSPPSGIEQTLPSPAGFPKFEDELPVQVRW
jgi:hypothetical protein